MCRGASGRVRSVPKLKQSSVEILTVDIYRRGSLEDEVLDSFNGSLLMAA